MVQPPTCFNKAMLKGLVFEAQQDYSDGGPYAPIFLYELEEIEFEEINQYKHLRIRNGRIFYIPQGPQQSACRSAIDLAFCRFFLLPRFGNSFAFGEQEVPIYHEYTCGTIQRKYSDGGIRHFRTERVILAVEIF